MISAGTDLSVRNLVLILGDQLTDSLAALSDFDATRDLILMVEVRAEAIYVNKHKQKIAFVLAAIAHRSRPQPSQPDLFGR